MDLLKSKLKDIIKISIVYGFDDIKKLTESALKNYDKKSQISIFVCGRFKSGKSSFINSILKTDILPTGVIPVTGVITTISYSSNEEFIIHFYDGKLIKVEKNNLPEYITEEKNPSNTRNVEYVEIKIPFDKSLKDILFIDTPGFEYSSIHSEITSSLISEVELAIVCISFDSPLSENDIKLINQLKKHTPSISVVITKVDLINLDDRKKVINFIKNKLNDISIYEYSTKDDTIRQSLIENLLLPIVRQKDELKNNVILHKVDSIENYLISCLKTLIEIKTKEKNEIERFKESFSKLLSRFESFKKDIRVIASNDYIQLREKILKIFLSYTHIHREFKKEIYNKLYSSSNLLDVSQNYEKTFKTVLSKRISDIIKIERFRIIKILEKENSKIYDMCGDFVSETINEANRILNAKIPFIPLEKPEVKLDIPKLKIFSAFDIHIELLWFIIPTFIKQFKKYIMKRIINNIDFEVEKNLTRTAMEISQSLKNSIDENINFLIREIENRLNTIKQIYLNKDIDIEKIQKDINFLEQKGKTHHLPS